MESLFKQIKKQRVEDLHISNYCSKCLNYMMFLDQLESVTVNFKSCVATITGNFVSEQQLMHKGDKPDLEIWS